MICKNCDSEMRTMVDVTMIFPSRFDHLLTKQVIRRKDAEIYAAMWDRADHICPKCGTTYSGTSTAWDKKDKTIEELVDYIALLQISIVEEDCSNDQGLMDVCTDKWRSLPQELRDKVVEAISDHRKGE